MEAGGGWRGPTRLAALASTVLLAAAPSRAPATSAQADQRCRRAEAAERESRELEVNAERRARFLEGADLPLRGGAGGGAAAFRSSARRWMDQARALRSQLHEGAANARHDRGSVPGLAAYFERMDRELGTAVQALETCLDAPERCSPPALSCPPPPSMPAPPAGAAGEFTRQLRGSYAQGSAAIRTACDDFAGTVRRDLERAARERRAAGAASPRPVAGTELYGARISALRKEAAGQRLEADRVSGVRGYCAAPPPTEGARAAGGTARPTTRVDLAGSWSRPWSTGQRLATPSDPLPAVTVGRDRAADRGGGPVRTADWWPEVQAERDQPPKSMGERVKGWLRRIPGYREADAEMQLTEFILGWPKSAAETVISGAVELLPVGKAAVVGYKLHSAVKDSTAEVMQIVMDAPQVLAHGSAADEEALQGRATRAPINFLSSVFDDATGVIPKTRYPPKAPTDD